MNVCPGQNDLDMEEQIDIGVCGVNRAKILFMLGTDAELVSKPSTANPSDIQWLFCRNTITEYVVVTFKKITVSYAHVICFPKPHFFEVCLPLGIYSIRILVLKFFALCRFRSPTMYEATSGGLEPSSSSCSCRRCVAPVLNAAALGRLETEAGRQLRW